MSRIVQLIGFIVLSISIPTYLIVDGLNKKEEEFTTENDRIELEKRVDELIHQKRIDSLQYIHQIALGELRRTQATKNDSLLSVAALERKKTQLEIARIRDSANVMLDYIKQLTELKDQKQAAILELYSRYYNDSLDKHQIDRALDTLTNGLYDLMRYKDTKTDYSELAIKDTSVTRRLIIPIDMSYQHQYHVIDLINASDQNIRWTAKNIGTLNPSTITGLRLLDGTSQNFLKFFRVRPNNGKRFIFEFTPSIFDLQQFNEFTYTIDLVPDNLKVMLIFQIKPVK